MKCGSCVSRRQKLRRTAGVVQDILAVFTLLGIFVILQFLSGCASSQITGLPEPQPESRAGDGQVRLYEGEMEVKGGNLVTPMRGRATGYGCIATQVGTPGLHVVYSGKSCTVCYPSCDVGDLPAAGTSSEDEQPLPSESPSESPPERLLTPEYPP